MARVAQAQFCRSGLDMASISITPVSPELSFGARVAGVTRETVARLLTHRGNAKFSACAYEYGRGHPLAFARSAFGELATLHGDKGVWKLLDRHANQVVDVPVPGQIPVDVDTLEDYRALVAGHENGQ